MTDMHFPIGVVYEVVAGSALNFFFRVIRPTLKCLFRDIFLFHTRGTFNNREVGR